MTVAALNRAFLNENHAYHRNEPSFIFKVYEYIILGLFAFGLVWIVYAAVLNPIYLLLKFLFIWLIQSVFSS